MTPSRREGVMLVALAAVLSTAERITAQLVWALQKAAVAIHGSGSSSRFPDTAASYRNPAVWICLALGLAMIYFAKTEDTKPHD